MKEAVLVAGLGFGDEGKGSIVDYLTRRKKAGLIIRYNGGSQCGHNVVCADGSHHTFSQFGSGSFVPGAQTYYSRFAIFNPLAALVEAGSFAQASGGRNILNRFMVDAEAVVVTPFQRALNRLLEYSRGEARHGSCGSGIGQARSDHIQYGTRVLFAGDLLSTEKTRVSCEFLQQKCREVAMAIPNLPLTQETVREMEWLVGEGPINHYMNLLSHFPKRTIVNGKAALGRLVAGADAIIFEGGQGVLLDETHGTAPYNSWSDCTFTNADKLLDEIGFNDVRRRVGVLRSYHTRHGAGPFPTEDIGMTVALRDEHNVTNEFQREFRVGNFDITLAIYAIKACGRVDEIAMNHLDRVFMSKEARASLGVPVTIGGFGPTAKDKVLLDRRVTRFLPRSPSAAVALSE